MALVWRQTPKTAGKSSLQVSFVTSLLFRHRRQTDSVYLYSVETYDYTYNCIQNKKYEKKALEGRLRSDRLRSSSQATTQRSRLKAAESLKSGREDYNRTFFCAVGVA